MPLKEKSFWDILTKLGKYSGTENMFGDHWDINVWKNKLVVSNPALVGSDPNPGHHLRWSPCGNPCVEAKNTGKQDYRSQLPGRPSVVITKATLENQWHDIRAHSVATKIYTPTGTKNHVFHDWVTADRWDQREGFLWHHCLVTIRKVLRKMCPLVCFTMMNMHCVTNMCTGTQNDGPTLVVRVQPRKEGTVQVLTNR